MYLWQYLIPIRCISCQIYACFRQFPAWQGWQRQSSINPLHSYVAVLTAHDVLSLQQIGRSCFLKPLLSTFTQNNRFGILGNNTSSETHRQKSSFNSCYLDGRFWRIIHIWGNLWCCCALISWIVWIVGIRPVWSFCACVCSLN